MINQDRLKELLTYNPETGIFTWNVSRGGVTKGDEAGQLTAYGYRAIRVDGTLVQAHRLAFMYMIGDIPDFIDHEDHNRLNNKWDNLKETTRLQNQKNQKLRKDSVSGVTGVNPTRNGKWQARIFVNGKSIQLGTFDEIGDAVQARLNANKEYGFHENHGKQTT